MVELLKQLYLAIRDRLDPPPIEEAHWWEEGIRVTDLILPTEHICTRAHLRCE